MIDDQNIALNIGVGEQNISISACFGTSQIFDEILSLHITTSRQGKCHEQGLSIADDKTNMKYLSRV